MIFAAVHLFQSPPRAFFSPACCACLRRMFPTVLKFAEAMVSEIAHHCTTTSPPPELAPAAPASKHAPVPGLTSAASMSPCSSGPSACSPQHVAPSQRVTPCSSGPPAAQLSLIECLREFVAGVGQGLRFCAKSGVWGVLAVAQHLWALSGCSSEGAAEAPVKAGEAAGGAVQGGGIDIQHLLEEALLNMFVEGLLDINASDFPGVMPTQVMMRQGFRF